MKTPLLAFLALCSLATAQDRSIEALRRQVAQGYHAVNPRTQTQARAGDPEAQARLQYQRANAQATGDQNTGRADAYQTELARQRAAMAYQAEMLRQQQQRQIEELRRQTEELQRIRMEMQRRSYQR